MANSSQSVVAPVGGLASLIISFAYLRRTDIKVYYNEVLTTAWSWAGTTGNTIAFSPPAPAGTEVLVRRETDVSKVINVYSGTAGNAQFNDVTLDENFEQTLQVSQELQERVGTALDRSPQLGFREVNGAGAYRARNNRMQDLADPVYEQDATNKRWVDVLIGQTQTLSYNLFEAGKRYAEALVAGVQGGYGAFIQVGVGAVVRTFQDKMRDAVAVPDFGARSTHILSNVGVDSSPAFQKIADLCDNDKARYLKIPGFQENFRLNDPVKFKRPGVRIFGDVGGSYNRSTGGEGGWLDVAGAYGFDLGSNRTAGINPADNWELANFGLKSAPGVASGTVDGIRFTSRTNGPDRGVNIRSVSFRSLKDAITVEHPDVETVLASLSLDGVVAQGCRSIINAKGNTLGTNVRNIQGEQNAPLGDSAVFNGLLNACTSIKHSMLEGQYQVVSVDIPPITGNQAHLEYARNYQEAMTGKYTVRYRTTTPGTLDVGPNYCVKIESDDYVLLEDSSGAIDCRMRDPFPVVFKNSASCLSYGSKPFYGINRAYGVRQVRTGKGAEIYLEDYLNLCDDKNAYVHVSATGATEVMTPVGKRSVVTGNNFIDVPVAVADGDLVSMNILCRGRFPDTAVQPSVFLQIYDAAKAQVVREWATPIGRQSAGRWALLSIAFTARVASTGLSIRIFDATGTVSRAMVGANAKNHGPFTNDGASKVLIEPCMVNLF